MDTYQLSGRTKSALLRQQRRIEEQIRDLQRADRLLSGTLIAADPRSQREMLENYVEALQELRVSIERLEAFLLRRMSRSEPACDDDTLEPLTP